MFTYNTLVSAVQELAEDSSDELLAYIPRAIDLAEIAISRELDNVGFTKYQSAFFTSSDPFLSRPPEALVVKYLAVIISGRTTPLELRTDEFINDYWPSRTSTGIPKYYANWGPNKFLVAPAPASTFSAEMAFTYKPAALSAANQSSYLTSVMSDVLLYRTMMEVALFLKNPTMKADWQAAYENAAGTMLNQARRERRDDSAVAAGMPENNLKNEV